MQGIPLKQKKRQEKLSELIQPLALKKLNEPLKALSDQLKQFKTQRVKSNDQRKHIDKGINEYDKKVTLLLSKLSEQLNRRNKSRGQGLSNDQGNSLENKTTEKWNDMP